MTLENQQTEVIHASPEISKIPSKHHFAVSVRVRPLTPQESLMGEHASTISVFDENVVIFDPSAARASRSRKGISDHHKRTKEHRYAFDRVFSAATSQMEVFEHTTKPLIDGVLDGYNATVFAYGATGAGKTHTMAGTPSDPGIMVLTMCELFGRIKELENEKIIDLRMTYLEIYNETIRDLLVDSGGTLDMREDDKKGIVIPSLSEHTPEDVQQVMALLKKGNANRMMSPTMANATSSRSHAVLQIHIQQRDRTANIASEVQCAKLTLIDLAGSERASVTQNKTERFREGANINRSLLALGNEMKLKRKGNCINALCSPRKGHHIPYRDSKLTRLLKYSLGGNCRTVMIAAVSPSIVHFEDTYNTLVYANRAKNIKTNVERNTVSVNYHIRQYTQIISDLRLEIAELKEKMNNEKTEEATVTLPQMNEISILNSKRQMDEMIKELETIKNILVANESYCAALNGQSTLYEVLIDIKCFLASIGDYLEEKENEIYFRLEEFEKFISMQFEQLEVDLAHLWNESETIRAGLIELNSQANNKLLNDHLVLFEQLVGQSRTEIEKEEFMMYHQVQQTIIDFQRFWTLRVFDYLKENPNHSKSSWMNLCENFFSIDLVKSVINEGEFRSCSRLSISSLDKSRLSILSGHEFVIHSPRSLSARRPQTSVKIGSLKQDSSDILINSPSTPKIQKSAPLINSTVKDALQTWFQNDSLKSTPRKHKSLSTTPLSRSVADFKKFKKTNSFSASKEGLFTNLQEKLEKAKKSKQSLEKIDDFREVRESLENSFGSV
ncbi:kinesin-domain-containing protein, partial [Rozella allomycis CSF55]